jgi:RimJ/RimL family protein N-acetyltransferase
MEPKYSFSKFKTLNGLQLSLRPLESKDLPLIAEVLLSPTTWFSMTRDITSVDKFIAYFKPVLERQSKGESLTLIAERNGKTEVLGMSTYQCPSAGFRKVEIGFTWIADKWQRTFVNTEMKYLMLKHAFEVMKTNRVEFSVHPENAKSNTAMKRIGATFEGTLRKWRFLPGSDDGNRNMYSILDDEWPQISKSLQLL